MTKQGNRIVRWAITEATYAAIQKDIALHLFFERIRARHGMNAAKVVTARKLLTIVYQVWKEHRPYEDREEAVALSRH